MLTTEQVKNVPNPSGRGGFADHPENINKGGRYRREESLTQWMSKFSAMTVTTFEEWEHKSSNEKTMAAVIAYERVKNAKDNLKDFKEVVDRVDGKAPHSIISLKH